MFLGGIQKSTLIDYPGKIGCVLFFSGCNFHCPYCHNPDLARGQAVEPWAEQAVFDFLEARKGFLEGVVISGGEPTLHPDLVRICRAIREMGYPIKLDTNGSRPKLLERLIAENLIDYLAMDVKTAPENYARYVQKDSNPEAIISSIRIVKTSGVSHEFRTTCIKPLIDSSIMERIGALIEGANRYVLQRFHPSHVLDPDFFQKNQYDLSETYLEHLRTVAKKWVDSCLIR